MNTTTHKYDLRRRSINATALALGGFIALAAAGPSVAQTANAGDVFNWMAYQTNGNTVSVVPSASSANAVRDMGWKGTATATADIGWAGRPSMRNGAGNAFAVDVIAKTPAAKAAKLLSAGLKAAPVIGTGIAIWELCNELGFGCGKDATGAPVVTKSDPTACTVAPCYEHQITQYTSSAWMGPQAICNWLAGDIKAANPGYSFSVNPYPVYSPGAGGQGACLWQGGMPGYNNYSSKSWAYRSVAPASSGAPSSIQDLEDAISSQSGWPSGSHVHDALKDAAQATGQKIPLENPRVTGPATSEGTTKTTHDPARGTTTTTTTTYNHSYQDNRVTNNVTTSVNVTNNTTGQTETTTTEEELPIEQTDCEKNPKAWGCSDLDTPNDEVPKKDKQLTFTPENIGLGNGSCPSPIPVHTSKGDWILNLGPYCDATVNYVRPVVILFGLLAAFFIAVPGGVKL